MVGGVVSVGVGEVGCYAGLELAFVLAGRGRGRHDGG